MPLDFTGLTPLDTSGLTPDRDELDFSGLTPLDTTGLTEVEPAAASIVEPAPRQPGPDDSWLDLGIKLVENLPARMRQVLGGTAQAIGESEGPWPAGFDPNDIQFQQGVSETFKKWRDAPGGLDDWGKEVYAAAAQDLQENAPNVDPESIKGYAYDATSAFIEMIPTLATAIITKNPNLGLTVMGAQVAPQFYGEARAEGRTPDQASIDMVFNTLAETITERIPLGILTKQGAKFMPKLLKAMGAEGVQEMFTQVLQDGYDAGVIGKDMTWGEALHNMKRAGIIGGLVGGGMATAAHPFTRGEREKAAETPPEVTQEDIDSPIPTEDIAEGKKIIQEAQGEESANTILKRNGAPAVGSRVTVDLGDGQAKTGTVDDAFRIEHPELGGEDGVKINLDDGGTVQEFFSQIEEDGGSITPTGAAVEAEFLQPIEVAPTEPAAVDPELVAAKETLVSEIARIGNIPIEDARGLADDRLERGIVELDPAAPRSFRVLDPDHYQHFEYTPPAEEAEAPAADEDLLDIPGFLRRVPDDSQTQEGVARPVGEGAEPGGPIQEPVPGGEAVAPGGILQAPTEKAPRAPEIERPRLELTGAPTAQAEEIEEAKIVLAEAREEIEGGDPAIAKILALYEDADGYDFNQVSDEIAGLDEDFSSDLQDRLTETPRMAGLVRDMVEADLGKDAAIKERLDATKRMGLTARSLEEPEPQTKLKEKIAGKRKAEPKKETVAEKRPHGFWTERGWRRYDAPKKAVDDAKVMDVWINWEAGQLTDIGQSAAGRAGVVNKQVDELHDVAASTPELEPAIDRIVTTARAALLARIKQDKGEELSKTDEKTIKEFNDALANLTEETGPGDTVYTPKAAKTKTDFPTLQKEILARPDSDKTLSPEEETLHAAITEYGWDELEHDPYFDALEQIVNGVAPLDAVKNVATNEQYYDQSKEEPAPQKALKEKIAEKREEPAEDTGPAFEDFRALLPKDKNGDPDIGAGVAIIGKLEGVKSGTAWGKLSPDQKRAAIVEAGGTVKEPVETVAPESDHSGLGSVSLTDNATKKGRKLLVMGCCATKDKQGTYKRAWDRYTGPMFQSAKKTGVADHVDVVILSAEYGLIHSETEIPDYDTEMTKALREGMEANSDHMGRIKKTLKGYDEVLVAAGSEYRALINSAMGKVMPSLKGGIGEQRSQLSAWLQAERDAGFANQKKMLVEENPELAEAYRSGDQAAITEAQEKSDLRPSDQAVLREGVEEEAPATPLTETKTYDWSTSKGRREAVADLYAENWDIPIEQARAMVKDGYGEASRQLREDFPDEYREYQQDDDVDAFYEAFWDEFATLIGEPVETAEAAAEPEPQKVLREKIEAKREAPTGDYTLEEHGTWAKRIQEGDVTAAEAKVAFDRLAASEESVKAELAKLKNAVLIKNLPLGHRGEKKDRLVDSVYDRMLSTFLAKGTYSWSPFAEKVQDAIRREIDAQTDEDLQAYAKEYQEQAGKRLARHTALLEGMKDPKTIEDFHNIAQFKGQDAFEALPPEKLALYDELRATARREHDEKERAEKATVKAVEIGDTTMEMVETKHTRDGYDLFVVKLSDRVSKETYKDLLAKAKKLGGWYSRYTKGGAVPGFQFKAKKNAEQFMSLKEGDIDRSAQVEEKQAASQGTAVERLRAQAESLDTKAQESLDADRLTNTAKRAREAAGAEASANADRAMAQTMNNLAGAIESGEAKHLGGIRTKSHVEVLEAMARRAKMEWIRLQQRGDKNLRYDKLNETPMTADHMQHAVSPLDNLTWGHIAQPIQNVEDKKGATRDRALVLKRAARNPGEKIEYRDNLRHREIVDGLMRAYKDAYKYAPITDSVAEQKRLEKMGLRDLPSLRAALREYVTHRGKKAKADPIKEAERAMVGVKIPGYFRTPVALAEQMVNDANISSDMTILEPSAGDGRIADAINAQVKNADLTVIEPQASLRNILELKGHTPTGERDFLEHTGYTYDRIVMNPPFEKGQDIDHVRHAYDLLEPGGRIVAIMSEGVFGRNDRKATEFREWLAETGSTSDRNPEGTFKESGTGVATRIVFIEKPGEAVPKVAKTFADKLDQTGFAVGLNDAGYKMLGDPAEGPWSVERTDEAGNRETIVGMRGETFISRAAALDWAKHDQKTDLTKEDRPQIEEEQVAAEPVPEMPAVEETEEEAGGAAEDVVQEPEAPNLIGWTLPEDTTRVNLASMINSTKSTTSSGEVNADLVTSGEWVGSGHMLLKRSADLKFAEKHAAEIKKSPERERPTTKKLMDQLTAGVKGHTTPFVPRFAWEDYEGERTATVYGKIGDVWTAFNAGYYDYVVNQQGFELRGNSTPAGTDERGNPKDTENRTAQIYKGDKMVGFLMPMRGAEDDVRLDYIAKHFTEEPRTGKELEEYRAAPRGAPPKTRTVRKTTGMTPTVVPKEAKAQVKKLQDQTLATLTDLRQRAVGDKAEYDEAREKIEPDKKAAFDAANDSATGAAEELDLGYQYSSKWTQYRQVFLATWQGEIIDTGEMKWKVERAVEEGKEYAKTHPAPTIPEELIYEFDLETARGQKTHFRVPADPEVIDQLKKNIKKLNQRAFYNLRRPLRRRTGSAPDYGALAGRLRKMGLSDKIALRIVARLETPEGEQAEGRYLNRLIEIALDTREADFTLDHEVMHGLRDLGLIKPAEWRVLEKAARADEARMARIREDYPDLTDAEQVGEAVADMHGDYGAEKIPASGFIRAAFERINAFFKALRATWTDSGYRTAEDVFEGIQRGYVGRREGTRTDSGARAAQYALTRAQQRTLWDEPAQEEGVDEDVWAKPVQAITSAATSVNQIAASLKKISWVSGTINADLGGGKYDRGTGYLSDQGVENVIYDPFNRAAAHNAEAVEKVRDGQANTATVLNVLNIIQEPENRERVIAQAANAVGPGGTAYFQVYEGDKSGSGKPTTKGWQEHRRVGTYLDEIREHFWDVTRRGQLIIAKGAKGVEAAKFSRRRVSRETPEPERRRFHRTQGAEGPIVRFDKDSSEAEYQDSTKGIAGAETIISKFRDRITYLWNGISRHYIHLPNTARFAEARERLRELAAARMDSKRKVIEHLQEIVGGLRNPREIDLFTRKVILDDFMYEISQEHEVGFDLTPEDVPRELAKVDAALEDYPHIQEAVRKRKLISNAIVRDLVKAGVLTKEQTKNPAYFRHQVLEYARAQRLFAKGAGNKLQAPYWAKRKGSPKNINAHFLEAEFEWMQKAYMNIAEAEAIEFFKQHDINIRAEMIEAARRSNAAGINALLAADMEANSYFVREDRETGEQIMSSPLNEEWMGFKQQIAIGLSKVKKADFGAVPPHLEGAAERLVWDEESDIEDSIFPFLEWLMDNNKPGAEGAGMVFKAINARKSWVQIKLGKEYADMRDMESLVARFAPEGYRAWQPKEGRAMFTALSIPEHVMNRMVEIIAETDHGPISAAVMQDVLKTIRPVLAVGGSRYQLVIPEELAATLDSLGSKADENMVSVIAHGSVRGWKIWTLINPRRVIKYNVNNYSGDFDAVLAGNPQAVKHLWPAIKELHGVMLRGKKPSATLERAMKHGVLDSGWSIQEIPEISMLMEFEPQVGIPKLTEPHKRLMRRLKRIWRGLRLYTQWRENWLRYAAFINYENRINNGESMESIGYGAANKELVDAQTDNTRKAALLARELVGDYGAISHHGQFLRRNVVPFYSWLEINTKRYWRFGINAWGQGVGKGLRTGTVLGVGLGIRMTAWLAFRSAIIYGLVQLWNNLVMGDEEEELNEMDRRRLHINFGKWDGKIRLLRFQGALSDFAGWIGFEDVVAVLSEVEKGRAGFGEIIEAIAKAPVNRVVSGFTPFITAPLEGLTGTRFFWPDVFNPQPIKDGWRHAAALFSLEHEYDLMFQKPSRGYGQSLADTVFYSRDVGEASYNRIKGMTYDWLERVKGQEGYSAFTTPRSTALYNFRKAKKFGDAAATRKAQEEIDRLGIGYKDIRASLKRARPLGALAIKDRGAFLDTLTSRERRALDDANKWYEEVFLD